MRLTCLSKTPSQPSASWVRRPHLVVRPPRGLRIARHHLFDQMVFLPQASVPASEFHPGSAQPARGRLLLLSRGFSPLQRNPTAAIHHPRALPARVTLRPRRSSRPRRLAPATISRVYFNPTRSWGFFPSELHLTAIVNASRRDIPSCDWHPACRCIHMDASRKASLPGSLADPSHPQMRVTARLTVHDWALTGRRSRSRIIGRLSPDVGPRPDAASLQGFHPAAGWDGAIGFLLRYTDLALLGFLLPGAFSFHCLGLHSRGRRSPLGPRLGPAAASLPASSTR